MTNQYFANFVKQSDDFLKLTAEDLKLPPTEVYIDAVYHNLYTENIKKVEAMYSAGSTIDDIYSPFNQCLLALFNYKSQPDTDNVFFIKEVDEYTNALFLLTWGLSLKIDQTSFDQLVSLIDSEGQSDALVDLLVATRQPNRPRSQTLYFSKLYKPLYDAVQTRSSQQIARFLTTWYKTCLGKTANYEIHTLHGGDDSGFTGYWAWEVAGLTYALGIDDAAYRAMPYYPADLVAFARSR